MAEATEQQRTNRTYRDRVVALEQTWARWAEVGARLGGSEWSRPTRCAGWDVTALYAHVSMFPPAIVQPPPAPDEVPGAPVTAADILRGFNTPDGVAHEMAEQVAQAAVVTAANLTRAELVEVYASAGPRAIEALRGRAPSSVLPWPASGAVTTWNEAVRIVLLESVVHLLDVLDALGEPPELPRAALGETARLLTELTDPVGLIEAAAGRSAVSPFPVLR